MPTALRILHGEREPARLNRHEPVPRDVALVAPDWLPDDVRAVWDRTVLELEAMGLAASADADALVVLCQACTGSATSS